MSIFHPWLPLLIFHRENSLILPTNNSPLSPALSATSPMKSTLPQKSGSQVWSLPHAYTNKTQAHSLSLHIHHYLSSPLWLPHFRVNNTTALTQQNADPKIKLQGPYWNPISGQVKFFIQCLAALDPLHYPTAQDVLHDPWLTTITTTNMQSQVDLSPTLRQS